MHAVSRITLRASWVLASSIVLLTACGGPPPPDSSAPVQVEGNPGDLRSLAGQWAGWFHNERTGRQGTITFALEPGRDTAYARVVVEGVVALMGCTDPVSTATRGPSEDEFVLRLARLNVSHGSVGGWLLPYRDPDAACLMDTWFEGYQRGDVLEGSYFVDPADGTPIQVGSWRVERKR